MKTSIVPDDHLTPVEEKRFAMLEQTLERASSTGNKASLEMAEALNQIEEGRLYRNHRHSMKSYGRRWGLSPSTTSRLVAAGGIYRRISPLWKANGLTAPASAWQLLPLVTIPEANQGDVWKAACQAGKPITIKLIRECAAKFASSTSSETAPSRVGRDEVTSLVRRLGAAFAKKAKTQDLGLEEQILQNIIDSWQSVQSVMEMADEIPEMITSNKREADALLMFF